MDGRRRAEDGERKAEDGERKAEDGERKVVEARLVRSFESGHSSGSGPEAGGWPEGRTPGPRPEGLQPAPPSGQDAATEMSFSMESVLERAPGTGRTRAGE